ncbi:hypothetical protein [Alloyangia pacifica]|uniref:Uncharacterized protein n=1 Tax=Alloyangia pacifica TaxID=311180 RepID=A0A1I6W269_9RHOB|nr:hypothetical protein [Alloyangia pacifica]SDI38634.1 hypothetical protein SAMN04488245_11564 [Alloyangia pacifica]SFT20068.1 hypothetical protein SAMN04488050_11465 [Alloyangia pacifica]
MDATPKIGARLMPLFESRLGLGKGSFERRAKRAAHRLPRWARRDLRALSEAQGMAGHPKLAMRLDMAELTRAEGRIARHLEAIDVKARRRYWQLGVLAGLMFNLALLAALMAAVYYLLIRS